MEELFDNIFILVPVALLIFLRVFAERARKRSERAKATISTVTPVTREPRGGSRKATLKVARKAKEKPSTSPTKPARRDLLGRLRDYFSGSLDQPVDRLEPLHFEEEATKRLGQFRTQTAGSPGTRPQVTSGYKEGLPGAMEESAAIVRDPATRFTFPVRLERLPPLKRAIVLSEVLGKPKSMQ
ncbi:MAG: hypothetical protein ABIJ86_15350 [Spirochaetota bacterium]